MNITPEMVYLIMQADGLKEASLLLRDVFIFLSFVVLVGCVAYAEAKKTIPPFYVWLSLPMLCVFLHLFYSFMPSTQTLATMYTLPAVLNSKQAQKLDDMSLKLLDLVDKKISEGLEGDKK